MSLSVLVPGYRVHALWLTLSAKGAATVSQHYRVPVFSLLLIRVRAV